MSIDITNTMRGCIFRKVLRLQAAALAAEKSGKVLNLMSTDTETMQVRLKLPRAIYHMLS